MNKKKIKKILKETVIITCCVMAPVSGLCLWLSEDEVNSLEIKNKKLHTELKVANERVLDQDYDIEQLELKVKLLNSENVLIDMGDFLTTGYCNCPVCCGKWAYGPTKSGKMPKAGRTVAVDPAVIPLGSEVIIDGKSYIAEDTGNLVKGKHIDVYYDNHVEASNHDMGYKQVYVKIK